VDRSRVVSHRRNVLAVRTELAVPLALASRGLVPPVSPSQPFIQTCLVLRHGPVP